MFNSSGGLDQDVDVAAMRRCFAQWFMRDVASTCASVSPGSHVINANLTHEYRFPYRYIFTCAYVFFMCYFVAFIAPGQTDLIGIIVSFEAITVMVTYTVTLALSVQTEFNVNLWRTAKQYR